ncbi:MAG TPA: shikimate kinase [Streptosporangiaceae bacterium]|nr:shikimate kinase [Streptosporangiaceae bacterium]
MSDEAVPEAPGSRPAAILVGPPGSGKSTVGPLLAARLNVGFLDTDDEIESIAGKPVGDIFVEDGEDAFRALEWPVVQRALRYPGVVALGSGAILDRGVQRLLAGQQVIYLETSFAEVARRVGMNKARVPVPGNPRGVLRAMLEERLPLYQSAAWATVRTDDLDPGQVASHIVAAS